VGSGPGESAEAALDSGWALKKCLVIGCGNRLRGDDSLGPHVTERLRHLAQSATMDISVIEVPQLDVTLVSAILNADLVILVDARVDECNESVKVEETLPATGSVAQQFTSHSIGMPELLGIARDWYGVTVKCYSVMPRGYQFEMFEGLSAEAMRAAEKAIELVPSLLETWCRGDKKDDVALNGIVNLLSFE
jgi:hydrogenase maturation protease